VNQRKEADKAKVHLEPAGAAPQAAQDPAPDPPADSTTARTEQALAEQVAKLQVENKELMNSLVRLQADFENYRKRVERDRHQESRRAVESLVESLLPVLDAFERAMAAHDDPAYEEYRKGFELIQKRLWDSLAKQGLEKIEAESKPFNPHEHHAIERVETLEHPDGTVIEELQAGYKLHDKVLRPAMVRVAIHPAERSAKREFTEN
jgi:molecular chaperone GrpE